MNKHTIKVFYDTHSWLGIVAGILLFIVSFSGLPAMFVHELEQWQTPQLRDLPAVERVDWQQLVDQAGDDMQTQKSLFIVPEAELGYATLYRRGEDKELISKVLSLQDGSELQPGHSDVAHLFEHLHTDLHLPSPFGRYLVGFAGMVMLLLIIAGVVIHTKWRQQFTTLRITRSWRLLLTDHHKLLGLWTLPFAALLAFTGTILGLLGLISPVLALAKFDGNVDAAVEAVVGPDAEIQGVAQQPLPLNRLYELALAAQPDLQVERAELTGWGDAGALVNFSGRARQTLSNLQSVTLNAVSGEIVHQADAREHGPFYRIFAAVTPLHYVMFGDELLKLFYALCTLALSAIVVSGMMIWLDKKQRRDQRPHWLAALTLGSCQGLVLAMAAALAVSSVSHSMAAQALYEETVFWLVWGLWIAVCLLLRNLAVRTLLSHGCWLIAAALLLAVGADSVLHNSWQGSAVVVKGVNLSLLLIALLSLFVAYRLKKTQNT